MPANAMIDRESELRELGALLTAGAPRMLLLHGRRRVGKTFLLTHVWPEAQTFYFTAANTTPDQNRQALIADIARWSGQGLDAQDYPTWRTVFRLLLELRAPEPIALVLDEFQYLGRTEEELAAVASELNAVWEERRPIRPLVLALAGSAVRTMEALATGAAPLHGRLSWQGRLEPFDYWHASRLAPFRALRDRALAYGIFGGIPRYLAAVQPKRTLAQNAADLFLHPRGDVRSQVETALLQEQGLRDIPGYHAILRAIAGGRTELNEISQRAGVPNDTGLRSRIGRLIELGYVLGRRNFQARPNEPIRYHLADPAQMFHAEFVAPFEAELARNEPRAVWQAEVQPRLDTYMGFLFERIAEQAYYRLRSGRGLPLIREWGRWEGRDRNGDPVEFDLVAETSNHQMLTGQVKWNRLPLQPKVHQQHLANLDRLAEAGVKWAHLARQPGAPLLYIAAGGFSSAFAKAVDQSDHPAVCWALGDLYPTSRRSMREPTP